MESKNTIIARNGWLNGKTESVEFRQGMTLGEFADDHFPEALRSFVMAQKDGEIVANWEAYSPRQGDHILLYVMPQGGGGGGGPKKALMAIAAIAVAFIAPEAIPLILGGGAVGTVTYWVGASLILSALARSLFKPPEQQKPIDYSVANNPFLSFSGIGNRMEPWGHVMRVYGRMRVYPKLIAPPEQRANGSNLYYYLALDFGYGPLRLSNFKLGETSLNNYSDVEQVIHYNFTKNSSLSFFDSESTADSVNQELLNNNANEVIVTTQLGTHRAVLTFAYPNGLYRIQKTDGKNFRYWSLLKMKARLVTTPPGPWRDIQNVGIIKGSRLGLAYPGMDNLHRPLILDSWQANGVWHTGIMAGRTHITVWQIYYSLVTVGARYWIWDSSGKIPKFTSGICTSRPPDLQTGSADFSWDGREIIFNTYAEASQVPALPVTDLYFEYKSNASFDGYHQWSDNDNGIATSGFSNDVVVDFEVPGQYEIKISNDSGADDQWWYYRDQVYWASLVSYAQFSRKIFRPEVPHTVVELKIKATNQLSGMIDDYNAIAESLLPIWNGTSWTVPVYNPGTGTWNMPPTRNPAWIYLDILRGSANRRPVADNLIDLDEFLQWAADNDEPAPNDLASPSFLCDMIIGSETTVKEALLTVASVGRGAPGRRDSKFSIIRDKADRVPVQLITPKNSRDFSGTISYVKPPHALKVSYLDETQGFSPAELIVYNDGYNADNATDYEELSLPGTVRHNQGWRLGRYYMATAILQRERVQCSIDYENLICQRGDLVLVAHDVLKAGGIPRRVMKVTPDAGGAIITLDEATAGASVIRYRASDTLINVSTVSDTEFRLPIGQTPPIVGDLIEYGVSSEIRAPFLVEEIMPGADLSATVTFVEFRPEIETAITQPIPPRIPRPGASGEFALGPVRNLVAEQRIFYQGGSQFVELSLTWLAPSEGYPDYYNVYENKDGALYFIGRTDSTHYANALTVNTSAADVSANHTFSVEPVIDRIGVGPIETITTTIAVDTTPPEDVLDFGCNAQTNTLLLFWRESFNPDIHHYEIRYSADINALWQDSTLLSGMLPPISRQTMVPLRPGIYFIKAVDDAGNYSVNPAFTVVQIDDLEYVDEFDVIVLNPFTDGTHDRTELNGVGNIVLLSGENLGYYTPDPDVHKIELSALSKMRLYATVALTIIDRSAVLGGEWFIPLANAIPLQPSTDASSNIVDAQIEFRYRASLSDPFGPWTRLIVADVTAIEVEFRIQLYTKNMRYSPAVLGASIKADWLERTEIGQDISVPAGGITVNYEHPFAATPVLAITHQDADAGDYWQIATPTRNGFHITLYDNTNTSISGLIDFLARGYGKEY